MALEKAFVKADATDDGSFQRKQSEFRDRIGDGGRFPPAADRYHLYVQYACPWAHRTLLARNRLGLEDAVTVDVVDWRMQEDGSWIFNPDEPGCTADSQNGYGSLQEVYRAADPDFGGIGTVPVLWDKQEGTVVNNESREILRMLDTALAPAVGDRDAWKTAGLPGDVDAGDPGPLLPATLQGDVDAMIDANYESVNNGVYKAGFARTQDAYDEAVETLFQRLDELEAHLDGRDWLVGDGRGVLTEADICLWTTLLRFDPVYFVHFKCSRNLIREMPNLSAFVERFRALPGVEETVDLRHIKNHYYWSHPFLNPRRIVPVTREA